MIQHIGVVDTADPGTLRLRLARTTGFTCGRKFTCTGGVASEAHHGALLTLIDRCDAIFADLSGQNPNVLYELGFAVGRGKKCFAVVDEATVHEGAPVKPSNLRGQAVLAYDSNKSDWRSDLRDNWGPRYLDAALKVHRENEQPLETDSVLARVQRFMSSLRRYKLPQRRFEPSDPEGPTDVRGRPRSVLAVIEVRQPKIE